MSVSTFTIKILHLQHVSTFYRSSSGKPYINQLYTYRLMYGFPDVDLWKIEICWSCNVLIIKLHFDIVQLLVTVR
jgi:hypothetical protein